MLVDVKVPVLSESVAEATLISWHKKQGDYVTRDENLIDVETDKVVLELPAPSSGVLTKIIKNDGATVVGGEIIATIDTEAKATDSNAKSTTSSEKETATKDDVDDRSVDGTNTILMPAARNLAEENKLDAKEISEICGTGRGGRITKEDVLKYLQERANISLNHQVMPTPEIKVTASTDTRSEKRVAMSRLRLRIAERLVQSQSTAAILTTFNEVNMQAIIELRSRYKNEFELKHGVKLGFTSFFVKAAVAALKKFPIVNASVDGADIVYHNYYDVGIAVGSPRGLVVPIIRDADHLSLAEIEQQITDFARRAQDGKLTIDELTGGTFSITNGGVFGSMLSTPIINPPQSAILGIHATKDRPVAENGQVVIRPMNYLALSYDHRIIDGREAVLALVAMKEALEYPMSPLLEA
ncbi:MAG: 2-oxoglutarate dehydrogenase complex dihydrolipoyllysine-residue succinyltransferase [Nitrosomonas sp.]|nr:2-oxoglutarate dehydrogenase complex dihydrolipoyllysine-residue succinyltransferase [Nitrosomonas sp.]MDP1949518.1 2-oxoglutarate dehydrogenase complex dihydrolipoyllysine-residue succinyltransferase [Nitrosomonas sp.]